MSTINPRTAALDPGLAGFHPGFASRLTDWLAEGHTGEPSASAHAVDGRATSAYGLGMIADAF